MSSPKTYQAIIIGSGQAGTPLASAFATAGYKTALIESTHLGGCCVNEGCTPTKTMIASGRVAYLTRRGQDFGIHTSSSATGKGETENDEKGKNHVVVDMLRVRQRKRDIVDSFRGGSERRIAAAGIDVLMGNAQFVDAKTVDVKMKDGSTRTVVGDQIFINTGERPSPPNIEGIDTVDAARVLDSTSIQELGVVPEHLVVLGGGYVGIEFAQLFGRLGAKVTVIQRGKQLLPREDPEVADSLRQILQDEGLTIHLNTAATRITPSSSQPGDSAFELHLTHTKTNTTSSITGTHILIATGRIPNTKSMNLPAAGITTTSKGYIVANEYLETSAQNIYVLGDVKGPPAFTHISYDDFRIIRDNHISTPPQGAGKGQGEAEGNASAGTAAAPRTKRSTKDRQVPYVVYTDPQLAHVGLHEYEARALYPSSTSTPRILTATLPMTSVARGLETAETRGLMKAVVDSHTGLILGFTCLSTEGGEVMSVVQMAMKGKIGWRELQDEVWAHPAWSEGLNNMWSGLK